jgi:hypothetical protein
VFEKLQNIASEPIFIAFGIKYYPYHFFDADFNLYQISHCPRQRTLPTKKLAKVKIGRCRGFKIDSRFVSLSSLQVKIFATTKVILPIEMKDNFCPF